MDDIRKTAEETVEKELAELPQEAAGERGTAVGKEEVRKELTIQSSAQNENVPEEDGGMQEGTKQRKEPTLGEESVEQETEVQRETGVQDEAGAQREAEIQREAETKDESDMQLDVAAQEEAVQRKSARKSGRFKSNPTGYLMMAFAFFPLLLAGWMRLNIAGTRLLYIDLWMGRICRYYRIPLTAAVVMAAAGFLVVKRSPAGDSNG